MSQSNDRPLPVRCQACGTILPADSIRCILDGQTHDEQGLAELRERCKVFEHLKKDVEKLEFQEIAGRSHGPEELA